MIELSLVGVRVELPTNTPIILLKERDGERFLPIFIGAVEATAIAFAIQGVVTPRPMTHDLMRDIVNELGVTMEYVAIVELLEGTFYATIRFTRDGRSYDVSSRPSDAIALAVRLSVPIYATEDVLNEASIPIKEEALDEGSVEIDPESTIEQFREFLESVNPEDFRG